MCERILGLISPKIQLAGNIRGMYDGIQKAVGIVQRTINCLNSSTGVILTEKNKQMDMWVEHYSNLYFHQNTVSPETFDSLECLQPTIRSGLDHLINDKAPWSDNIPPDMFKTCKSAQLLPLHEVLCQFWQEGEFTQNICDAKIITPYKNKAEWTDCNTYRGIFLLSIAGEIRARVILVRLQKTCRTCVSGITVWISFRPINNWYDFLVH